MTPSSPAGARTRRTGPARPVPLRCGHFQAHAGFVTAFDQRHQRTRNRPRSQRSPRIRLSPHPGKQAEAPDLHRPQIRDPARGASPRFRGVTARARDVDHAIGGQRHARHVDAAASWLAGGRQGKMGVATIPGVRRRRPPRRALGHAERARHGRSPLRCGQLGAQGGPRVSSRSAAARVSSGVPGTALRPMHINARAIARDPKPAGGRSARSAASRCRRWSEALRPTASWSAGGRSAPTPCAKPPTASTF